MNGRLEFVHIYHSRLRDTVRADRGKRGGLRYRDRLGWIHHSTRVLLHQSAGLRLADNLVGRFGVRRAAIFSAPLIIINRSCSSSTTGHAHHPRGWPLCPAEWGPDVSVLVCSFKGGHSTEVGQTGWKSVLQTTIRCGQTP